jgi:quercetin dioxygenase-like cupin family protein
MRFWFQGKQAAAVIFWEMIMHRTLFTFVIGAAIGILGTALAISEEHHKVKVTTLSERDISEKVDDKEAKATVVEVTMEPDEGSAPHRHAGPVFGYVLEGEYEWGINDQPTKKLRIGDTFYEPTGSLHRVSRNPNGKRRTRVLAIVLHPRDAKQITIPEPSKK